MLRFFSGLLLVALISFGVLYFVASRSAPPRLIINKPERVVGQSGVLDVTAEAPGAQFTSLTITVEQNGHATPLFALDARQAATVTTPDANHLNVSVPFGKRS